MQCIVLAHITTSMVINDDERGLPHDYDVWLERLAPHAPIDGSTERSPKSLAPAHGSFQASHAVRPGTLDSRRRKRVLAKIIGE